MGERKRYDLTNPRIPILKERFCKLVDEFGGVSKVSQITGISRPTINFWYNGERTPDAENLITLSKSLGVSVDWLLGLLDDGNSTSKANIRSISKYTGLSNKSVNTLCDLKTWDSGQEIASVIDLLLDDFCYTSKDNSITPLAYLIYWFLKFKGNGYSDKAIHISGQVLDCPADGGYMANAITLNDRLVESAALSEIQQSLISLKRRISRKER